MRPLSHTLQKLALALVALGALLLWRQSVLRQGEAQALATLHAAQRDSAIAATARADRLRLQADSSAHVRVTQLGTIVRRLGTQAAELRARGDSLLALDSLKPALAVKDSLLSLQAATIQQLQAGILLMDARWAAADSAAAAWKALAVGAQAQVHTLLARSQPRFACVGGVGGAGGFGGTAAGLSFTCGYRL